MARRFYIVDVFAERPYCGNPLAVVLDAEDLPDETMQCARVGRCSEEAGSPRAVPSHEKPHLSRGNHRHRRLDGTLH